MARRSFPVPANHPRGEFEDGEPRAMSPRLMPLVTGLIAFNKREHASHTEESRIACRPFRIS